MSTPLLPMGATITQLALAGSTFANSIRPVQYLRLSDEFASDPVVHFRRVGTLEMYVCLAVTCLC